MVLQVLLPSIIYLAFLILVSEITGLPWTGTYDPKQNVTFNIKTIFTAPPFLVSFPSSVTIPCNFYPVSLLVTISSQLRLSVVMCLVLMLGFMKADHHHLFIWPCEFIPYLEILILVFRTKMPLRIPQFSLLDAELLPLPLTTDSISLCLCICWLLTASCD